MVEVEKFAVKKNDKFQLTYEPVYPSKDIFIEINNFLDKKGFLLNKTQHGLVSDKWLTYLGYVIITLCTVVTFLVCLASGWLVIGLVLLIPGVIVGFLVMLVLRLLIMIIKGIFHEIYIRF